MQLLVEVITNRRQARHAWSYVLNNWRKHGEHRVPELRRFAIDPFSSASAFDGWAAPVHGWPPTYEPLPVHAAGSWLLRTGWRMYGLIDPREVPGSRARHRQGRRGQQPLELELPPAPSRSCTTLLSFACARAM